MIAVKQPLFIPLELIEEDLRLRGLDPDLLVIEAELRRRGIDPELLKYSEDQPRVPEGNPGGGQWTDGGSDSSWSLADATSQIQWHASGHGRAVVLRGGEIPKDGPVFAATDPAMADRFSTSKKLLVLEFDQGVVPEVGSTRWMNEISGKWRDVLDYYEPGGLIADPPAAFLTLLRDNGFAGFATPGGSLIRIEDRTLAKLSIRQPPKKQQKAIRGIATKADLPGLEGLPQIVTRTEFLALQYRYGFQRAAALVRARINLLELEQALRGGARSPIQSAAQIDLLGQTFSETARQTTEASYLRGAREGERALRSTPSVGIRFDAMNPHAAQYARSHSSQLITQIGESQREAVRNLVESAVGSGRTVQDIARDIRNVVGLRDDQVQSLLKYREVVSQRPKLTIDQIENKVRRYADALLRQRGELIARTEVLSSANAGQLEIWREAQRQGKLDGTYGKQWIITADEITCQFCEPLDGVIVGLNEVFQSDGETVQFPPLHPQCRCSTGLAKMVSR